jgi:hypothetical protein
MNVGNACHPIRHGHRPHSIGNSAAHYFLARTTSRNHTTAIYGSQIPVPNAYANHESDDVVAFDGAKEIDSGKVDLHMNSKHQRGIEMMTTDWELQYELLRTWEEYYQLLEIISHLSPDPPRLLDNFPVTDLSGIRTVVISKSAIKSPHCTQ